MRSASAAPAPQGSASQTLHAAASTQGSALAPLRCLAHGRTGDKGNRANISLIAWHPDLYPLLVEHVTPEAVAEVYRARRPSRVERYLLPRLQAINFVIDDVLDGGVNDALNLDSHGKALAFALLGLHVPVAYRLWPQLRNPPANDPMSTRTPGP
jgi:hypothetical protein